MNHDTIDGILKPATIEAIRASSTATCELLDPMGKPLVRLLPARSITKTRLGQLKELLLDPASWFFCVKRCLPRQSVLFRLRYSAKKEVTVLVDFPCAGWLVTGPAYRSGGFFDPVAAQVRELIKATFSEFASRNPRSLWKAGKISQLRRKAREETKE
jgi:hypothetical protein